MRPAGTPSRRVLKPAGASGNTRTSSGPRTMGRATFLRPCADEGPSVPPGLAPAAAASRIDAVTTRALFFIAVILFAGTL